MVQWLEFLVANGKKTQKQKRGDPGSTPGPRIRRNFEESCKLKSAHNSKIKLKIKINNYIPKLLSNSNTKNAGQTSAFKNPKTPIQKPVAVDMK